MSVALGLRCVAAENPPRKFSFGSEKSAPGYTQVSPTNFYNRDIGFGFEPGAAVAEHAQFSASAGPFYFSVALPEGNYRVTVTLGGPDSGSTNYIKAELRRLMLEHVVTVPGKFETRAFAVNIRTPQIPGDGRVRLKERERTTEIWNWDEKLTLEFNGTQPAISKLEIERADDLPTVYLLGDSTVCDQPLEPWDSWGQMLPRFFTAKVVVANNAESGDTTRSAIGARRDEKIFNAMKRGDYLFVQYGHNDMKDRSTNALDVYKSNLKMFIARTREKGATPVLVTSMERKAGVDHDTLGKYPETMREIAKEENVALIDLHAMSRTFYNALGRNLDKAFQDGTHHNNYGSYELAKCVVEGIQHDQLGLAKFIVNDFKGFDPVHPDPVDRFEMPASPGSIGAKPPGD